MSCQPSSIEVSRAAVSRYGVGAGGTRNIGGSTQSIEALENEIAQFHRMERGLVFSSGFTANLGVMYAMSRIANDCVVLSDEYNHASLIDGIRLGGSRKKIFAHNDMKDLRAKLSSLSSSDVPVVVVESVYSMGGICPLDDVVALCKEFSCFLIVDEIHAVTLYGESGAGIVEEKGLQQHVDMITAGFGKGFGVVGGYAVGSEQVMDFIRSSARSFIFTTALPVMVTESIRESIRVVASTDGQDLKKQFHKNVKYLKRRLMEHNIQFTDNGSHIVALPMGSATRAHDTAKLLLAQGHYVQDVNFPTTARGSELIRISVNAKHSHADIDDLCRALVRIGDH